MAVHYNQADHSINDVLCVILNENFTATADRQLYEQKLIQRFDTYKCGLNRDLCFLSKYALFILFLHLPLKPLMAFTNTTFR